VVSCKWILKSKVNPDGSLARRKARLVARGFSQTHGVDYFETFSPVVRYESVRCILSLAAAKKMDIVQFDVKTAFLNGDLKEEVFMSQPEGYEDGSGRVCKLNRSIYGLKQSSRNWNEKFNSFLSGEGLVATAEDTCVFVRHNGKETLIVCLYVDDGLVCGTNKGEVASFLKSLESVFEITAGSPEQYVGMEISRDKNAGTISISQTGYISRVLQRFGMMECKSVATPMTAGIKLQVEDSKEVFQCPYREAIGCLNYISCVSRPDITYAINCLARYSNDPKKVHWRAVKRVMQYLKGTKDKKLLFGSDRELVLTGHCDSDWGGEEDQRRSTTGYVFSLTGGPVSWCSRLQRTTALSVTEAE